MDDGRATLLAELARYAPADPHEAAMTASLIAFVRDNAACFERTLLIGHVTASAWVVDETRAYALLTHHRKLGKWLQLGGHTDGESDVRRAALREATEESGLTAIRFAHDAIYDIDVHPIPARGAEPAHHHYDIRFAFIADRTAPLLVSEESHALAWRPVAELDTENTDESVRRLARKTVRLGNRA
jgi:8-oxo-dGTP pyrophosphatase MutT (NUDIX family)